MDIIYIFHGYILPGFLMEKAQKEKEKMNECMFSVKIQSLFLTSGLQTMN